MNDIQLTPVKVNAETVRSFFTFEKTATELLEKNMFPFSPDSEKYTVTDEDLYALTDRLGKPDSPVNYRIWKKLFCEDGSLIEIPESEVPGYTAEYLFSRIASGMDSLAAGRDGWMSIKDTKKYMLEAAEKSVSEISIPEADLVPMLEYFDEKAEKYDLPSEYGRVYEKMLDMNWKNGNIEVLKMRAKAYNGGNNLARCDWKKAEESYIRMLREYVDSADAALELGKLYSSGRLGEPDYDKAFEFLTDSAGSGSIIALCLISDMYREGLGVKQNFEKVWSILEPLYAQMVEFNITGRPEVYANLLLRIGYCYRDGCGVSADREKAFEYFRDAAEHCVKIPYVTDDTEDLNEKISEAISELQR